MTEDRRNQGQPGGKPPVNAGLVLGIACATLLVFGWMGSSGTSTTPKVGVESSSSQSSTELNALADQAASEAGAAAKSASYYDADSASDEAQAPSSDADESASDESDSSSDDADEPATYSGGSCSSDYYEASSGDCVHRPEAATSAPGGATAQCADGTYSFSEHRRGTCSHHGGVSSWL